MGDHAGLRLGRVTRLTLVGSWKCSKLRAVNVLRPVDDALRATDAHPDTGTPKPQDRLPTAARGRPDPSQDLPGRPVVPFSLLDADAAIATVSELEKADVAHFKAKDILRAARLPRLPIDNPHVAKDLTRISKNAALSSSSVLLVRGELTSGTPMRRT